MPRWGDGRDVWNAAREAGIAGFVWKSHEYHTADRCAELPGPPHAIGSASLNPWAGIDDVAAAVEAGARWVWGPTCDERGENRWELPLPPWWDELRAELTAHPPRLVLATGHADADGRRRIAQACAAVSELTCSVTHSHFLADDELLALAATGCVFEFDCYTLTHTIPGRSAGSLARLARLVLDDGCTAYLTSDGGQASTGNPFEFAAATIERWRARCGDALLDELARAGPQRVAAPL